MWKFATEPMTQHHWVYYNMYVAGPATAAISSVSPADRSLTSVVPPVVSGRARMTIDSTLTLILICGRNRTRLSFLQVFIVKVFITAGYSTVSYHRGAGNEIEHVAISTAFWWHRVFDLAQRNRYVESEVTGRRGLGAHLGVSCS